MKKELILFLMTSIFLVISCENKESDRFENIIVRRSWTQVRGTINNTNYLKRFYKLEFNQDGNATIVYRNPFIEINSNRFDLNLDTVTIKYIIENNKIIFTEPYMKIGNAGPEGNDSITLYDVYFCDLQKIDIIGDIIHLKYVENINKSGIQLCMFNEEIYIEPLE